MKIKITICILTLISIVFLVPQNSLAQRKTPKKKSSVLQKPKSNAEKTILIKETSDAIEVTLNKLSLVYASPRQNVSVAAEYTTTTPTRAILLIVSVATSFQYANSSYSSILVDGEQLLSKNYQANRSSFTDSSGDAFEILRIPLELSEFEILNSARRVDIELNSYTKFALTYESKNNLNKFYQKIVSLAEVANEKRQRIEDEQIAKQNILDKERIAKQNILDEEKRKIAEEKLRLEAEEAERKRCKLAVNQSPEIKGLRLGLPIQDVITRFGLNETHKFDLKYNRTYNFDGADALIINYSNYELPKTQEWQFVSSIGLRFLEGKLYLFQIGYDNSQINLWKDTDSFVKVLSESMSLPPLTKGESSNSYSYLSSTNALAACEGWTIEITGGRERGIIELTDTRAKTAYIKAKEEKRRADEEKRRDIFKPNK